MKSFIYIDHIRQVNTPQSIERGSIVRSIPGGVHGSIGVVIGCVTFLLEDTMSISIISDSDDKFKIGSITMVSRQNIHLITCTIKIKQ